LGRRTGGKSKALGPERTSSDGYSIGKGKHPIEDAGFQSPESDYGTLSGGVTFVVRPTQKVSYEERGEKTHKRFGM